MKKLLFALLSLSLLLGSCVGDKDKTQHEWEWEDPVKQDPETPGEPDPEPDPEVPSDQTWVEVGDIFGELPEHVKVYKNNGDLAGAPAIAFIATVDTKKAGFNVWGINAPTLQGSDEPLKTPLQVYNSVGKPCVIINAGYFYTDSGKSYSSSLEVSEGTLLSPNINYASKDWITIYYPTRAAFIENYDGSYEVGWTYWVNGGGHWIYQEPAANSWDQDPLKQPDATFPSKGKTFSARNAIGGAPVLLKDGEIKDTYVEEMIEVDCPEPHPRTAIGITDDLRLVLFVCEGRNMTPGVAGMTTHTVAEVLKDFGCTDAINLDGGGSTLMLVNGIEVLKPSDKKERAVASCVYIK